MSKTYTLFRFKQLESMHGHWLISLQEQDHVFLGGALQSNQITWFTYVRGGQHVFDWDRLENFSLTRDRPVGKKVSSTKCQS